MKLKGLPSLIVIVVVVWVVIRAAHVLLPVVEPEVLPGPFRLASLAEVESITGFSARVPLYHPESLGTGPASIVASRSPVAEVTIVWRDQRFLEVVERPPGVRAFDVPDDSETVGDRPVHVWSRGKIVYLAGPVSGIELSLRTDLTREDAMRIVSTLVPLEEVK